MRCLALGQAWRDRGGEVAVLGSGGNEALRRRIETGGIRFTSFDYAHPDPGDLPATLSELEKVRAASGRCPWLVLDGYNFDAGYQASIRAAGHRLLAIDDLAHLPHYHASLVLNQNLNSERLAYQYDPDTLLLLGPDFVLLRREFLAWRGWRRSIGDRATRVLVTLGGSDPDNATLKVIHSLKLVKVKGFKAIVLVGAGNPRLEELRLAASRSGGKIRLLHNASNMPGLMAWADIAVGAGGTTGWEMAFMGLPSLMLVLAGNQNIVAGGLAGAGAAVNLGPADRLDASNLAGLIAELSQAQSRRREMSENGQRLVDGLGARRVVELAVGLDSNKIGDDQVTTRRAARKDAVEIWRLANNPTVRLNSYNSEPIPLDEHLNWYYGRLDSPGSRIWVLEVGGAICALVRYDRLDPDEIEVHFMVAEAFRGKGLGTKALEMTWRRACEELGASRVRGRVLIHNAPSARAFLKAGFERAGQIEELGKKCYLFEAGR